jgi:hypothetical protein
MVPGLALAQSWVPRQQAQLQALDKVTERMQPKLDTFLKVRRLREEASGFE